MLEHCLGLPGAAWLGDVILALATTGLRISELAAVHWSDIDIEAGTIGLVDATH